MLFMFTCCHIYLQLMNFIANGFVADFLTFYYVYLILIGILEIVKYLGIEFEYIID